jgi:hypothetical protein
MLKPYLPKRSKPVTDEQATPKGNQPKSLSDTREELGLARDPVKMDDLVGDEIVVIGIREWQGRYGPCATIHLARDGEPLYCVTGATVVRQKLLEVTDHFPLTCTIIKEEEYYDIV